MSDLPRICGSFSDFKLIKTRDVCQFVIEIPRAQSDAALEALGGLPRPGAEQWVALMPIRDEAAVGAADGTADGVMTDHRVPLSSAQGGGASFCPQQDSWPAASSPASSQSRRERTLAESIYLTCGQKSFQRFIAMRDPLAWTQLKGPRGDDQDQDHAAAYVVVHCGVSRKRDIGDDPNAFGKWKSLEADYFDWQRRGVAA